MLFSRACEYAIQAMLYLAKNKNRQTISIKEIAEENNISFHFLGKVLQNLTQKELLISFKGPKGGVKLAKLPQNTTLSEVVAAIDGLEFLHKCIIGQPSCNDHEHCVLHDKWQEINGEIAYMLENLTIAQIPSDHPKLFSSIPLSNLVEVLKSNQLKKGGSMSIFDTLVNEHHLIRRYLDSVEVVLKYMKEEDRFPPVAFFELGLEFTKSFSDTYHHYKEEYVMFMSLAQKKEGDIDSQITFLRDQHERARNFTSEISRAIKKYDSDEGSFPTSQKEIIIEFLGYYNLLLRQHIKREDHVFYPLAQKVFSESELLDLQAEFKLVENKYPADFFQTNEENVQKMETLLVEKFGDDYRLKMEALPKYHT